MWTNKHVKHIIINSRVCHQFFPSSLAQDLVAPLNALSLTGRALDALKLGAGAFAVCLLGNYVNFQPWDRDNCKLLNVWLMIASGMSGALLAAPVEYLLSLQPGVARLVTLTGGSLREARDSLAKPAAAKTALRHTASLGLTAAGGLALLLSTTTGMLMITREFSLYHVLLDEDQADVGAWISTNLAPKANFLHKDVHITPSGTLAGRTALISYNGACKFYEATID